MKVKKIVYQGKSYIIAKRNVLALLRNKHRYKFTNYTTYAHEVDVKN